jgi:phosphoglycerate kinase
MELKKLKDFNVKDKLVLLRIDINSPVVKGKIEDNPRFDEAVKTILYLIKKKAKTVILAHQGRPGSSDFLSLKQHSKILSKKTGNPIKYIDALFENKALEAIDKLNSGEVILMANVRNYDDESILAKSRFYSLSKLFDLYVNDAFSVSHREHGSIIVPPKVIPSCIGPNFEEELEALRKFSFKGKNILYVLGGAKIGDYLPIFKTLKNKNNKILAGGVLANLILVAAGFNLGYENTWLANNGYKNLMPLLKKHHKKYSNQIILPEDFAVGDLEISNAERKEIPLSSFPSNRKIWDLGHQSVKKFINEIKNSDIVFMKGPLGHSEYWQYSYSTVKILKKVSELTKKEKIFSLLGGGHLTTTMKNYKIEDNFSHTSTSGGALISFLSGEKLPAVEALKNRPKITN